VVGSKQAVVDGFSYSNVAKTSGKIRTLEELNRFLYNPRKYWSGTKMSFAGVRDSQERANLIAYINTLSDAPQPLT